MSTRKSTLAGKLRCLQSLLQQLGANVACEAVSEAIEQLADANLAQPAQSVDESMVDRMILEYMRMEPDDVKIMEISTECQETREFCRSLLAAALQEKGNGAL